MSSLSKLVTQLYKDYGRPLVRQVMDTLGDQADEATIRKAVQREAKKVATQEKPKPNKAFNIAGKADPAKKVMETRAAELDVPTKKRLKPSGVNPAFETSQEAYNRTSDIVPQSDPEVARFRIPRLPAGDTSYPNKNRIGPLTDMQEQIAQQIAADLRPEVGSNVGNFYKTGPMYEGIERLGYDPEEFMRQSFAPSYAGTSPRTNTLQNLRNASMIEYLRGKDIPINERTYEERGNIAGYPMMGSHYRLSNELLTGTHNPMINPKPSEFMHNVAGDQTGVTADTHDISGILYAMNKAQPGSVPEGFIIPEAREKYRETGELNFKNQILNSLGYATRAGEKAQVEYGPIADVNFRAAEILGIPGSEQQALQWFKYGPETGLVSDPKTVVDLMNDRLDVTAQVLGISPDEVMRLYLDKKIPLMAEGGEVEKQALFDKYA
jgi:hypothetical protein